MSNRRVFFYDDLSYWALYTKNIFTINRLPHLFENCSVDYKDYTPIIQILQYIAMFGHRSFSEPAMFRTNVCFIYVLLLPVLSVAQDNRIDRVTVCVAAVFYVIFPHILTAQFYYRLGVDLFLALVFGYILFYIFISHDLSSELFRMVCIITALSFLALVKSSGIVLCLLAIIMFIIKELVDYKCNNIEPCRENDTENRILNCFKGKTCALWVKTAIISVFALGSYFSWQLFLRYSWNNGYLSNRVKKGITDGGLRFPEYTGEVIRNYVNHFFTYPLTRSRFGVTAFMLVIFITAVYITVFIQSRRTEENTGVYTALFVSSMTGLMIFAIAHISMYLFVFDEWEAHGLMEYDRYITQYLGGIFYVFVCLLVRNCVRVSGEVTGNWLLTCISLVIFIALLPYGDMRQYLVPGNYEAMFQSEYAQIAADAANEWKASQIREMNLAHDGTQRLTVIANAWDETTQFLEYEAVPQPIDRILNVPAVQAGDLPGFIEDYMESYMYVARGSEAAYAGDWQETAEFTEDGEALCEGTLYRVNRVNGVKTLVPVYQNIGDFSY